MERRASGGSESGQTLDAQVLARMWPEIEPRLRRSLRRTGADFDAVDDALAEAATRALGRGLSTRSGDELAQWVFVVARNLLVDSARAANRFVPMPDMTETGDGYDVEAHVEHRQILHKTARAFASLSVTEQDSIRVAIDPPSGCAAHKEAGAIAVRRHRARLRLRRIVDAPIAIVIRLRSSPWLESRTARTALALSLSTPLIVGPVFLRSEPSEPSPPSIRVPSAPRPQVAEHSATATRAETSGNAAATTRGVPSKRAESPEVRTSGDGTAMTAPRGRSNVERLPVPQDDKEWRGWVIGLETVEVPLPALDGLLLPIP